MEPPLHHHFATHQHLPDGTIFASASFPPHPTLPSQDIALDTTFQFDPQLQNQPLQPQRNPFDHPTFHHRHHHQPPRFHEARSDPPSLSRQPKNHGLLSHTRPQEINEASRGQFGILSPHPQLPNQPFNHDEQLGRLQHELDLRPVPVKDGGTTEGHFSNMKMVADPPMLDVWRKRLFDVNGPINLTEDECVEILGFT